MGRPSRLPRAILVVAGVLLALAGAAAIAVGLLNPGLISSQLPPDAAVDTPAVGGAAVALGVAVVSLGLVHVAIAVALRSGTGVVATSAVVLASTMAFLALGTAIAAVVSIASGAAPVIYMVPASVGLLVAVLGYAIVTVAVIGARGEPI
ncbi:MAG: hypothetical protein ACXWMB_02910 [Candidatus Limnocylindria bacterium]